MQRQESGGREDKGDCCLRIQSSLSDRPSVRRPESAGMGFIIFFNARIKSVCLRGTMALKNPSQAFRSLWFINEKNRIWDISCAAG